MTTALERVYPGSGFKFTLAHTPYTNLFDKVYNEPITFKGGSFGVKFPKLPLDFGRDKDSDSEFESDSESDSESDDDTKKQPSKQQEVVDALAKSSKQNKIQKPGKDTRNQTMSTSVTGPKSNEIKQTERGKVTRTAQEDNSNRNFIPPGETPDVASVNRPRGLDSQPSLPPRNTQSGVPTFIKNEPPKQPQPPPQTQGVPQVVVAQPVGQPIKVQEPQQVIQQPYQGVPPVEVAQPMVQPPPPQMSQPPITYMQGVPFVVPARPVVRPPMVQPMVQPPMVQPPMVQPMVQPQPINLEEPPPVQQEYYGVPPVVPATRVSDGDDASMEPPVEDINMQPQPIPPRSQTIDMDKDLRLENLTAQVKQLQDQLNGLPSVESQLARALAEGDIQVSSANRPAKRTAPESVPLPKRQKVQGKRPPTTTIEEPKRPVMRRTSSRPQPAFEPVPKATEKVRAPDFSNIIDPDARKRAEENVKYADEKGFPRPIKFENTGEISKSRLNAPYWKKATRKLAD